MKGIKLPRPAGPDPENRLALRGGGYSLVLTALLLALLLAVNVFVSALPVSLTRFDISSSKLYSITSNTKVVANALTQDVTIYWIVQAGQEDEVLKNLLSKYDSLSDYIQVVKKNPDVFPTFAQQYTDEAVQNNSLVVECGDRSRYIGYSDIYLQEPDLYSYSYNTSFDGEGAITSAIDYVVTEDLPRLYLLEGHGEEELPATFREQLEKDNIQIQSLSLLTNDAVPEEADCVMIYAPQSDISTEEAELLAGYTKGGGKLLVAAGPVEEGSLDNLYSLLSYYGVTAVEGIVVEGDRQRYAFQSPYLLLPEMASSEITDPLMGENYYAILPIAQGLDTSGAAGTVTPLLTTSAASFSKPAGYDITTYEKEEGDIDGPFALGVMVDTGNDGQIVWFTSADFLGDLYNAYSSGANGDLAMNALSALIGQREAIAIRSKSLNYNYLTISASTASLLKTVLIGVFPLIYLGIGILVVLKRRREQNEAV